MVEACSKLEHRSVRVQSKSVGAAEFRADDLAGADLILEKLREAVGTLLRMRDFSGITGELATHWQRIQRGLIEARQLWAASMHWKEPTAREVAEMWIALSWLRFLLPTAGKMVLLASAGVSWKAMARYFSTSPDAVEDVFHAQIERIRAALAEEAQIAA